MMRAASNCATPTGWSEDFWGGRRRVSAPADGALWRQRERRLGAAGGGEPFQRFMAPLLERDQ